MTDQNTRPTPSSDAPAQVEVTDEEILKAAKLIFSAIPSWVEAFPALFIRFGRHCIGRHTMRNSAAITATDAKPVVPAEPVAFQFWLKDQQCWTNMPTDWKPEEDPEGKYTIRPLYAAPPSPVEGEVERQSLADLESALSACEDGATDADVLANYRIVRRAVQSLRTILASEGKTDA